MHCVLLVGMLFHAKFCGLGHARASTVCGNMTFQGGGTFVGCDSNKSTDKFTREDYAC
jgi:hypothetical protein